MKNDFRGDALVVKAGIRLYMTQLYAARHLQPPLPTEA